VYGNYYVVMILTLFLGIATYTDIKSLKIPNKLNLIFGIVAIGIIPLFDFSTYEVISKITGSLFGFLVLLIPAMIKMHPMGGDIKAIAVVGLYIGVFVIPVFLAMSCVYAVAYIYLKFRFTKKVSLTPFAPFFLASHITLWTASFFI
jgi:Flp pilus assembly protein protease CpaA